MPTSSSDTRQLSLLSGSPTPAKSCANEPKRDGFPACTCGKGMFDCSIHPSTRESWIASMQASLAKTLALLENRQAFLREPDQVFTAKSCASLAWYDPSSSSWRTYQQSFLTDSEPYLETWPRWGMSRNGVAYELQTAGRITEEIDGGYWPTPVKTDGMTGFAYKTMERKEAGLRRPSGAQIGSQLTTDRRVIEWLSGGQINPNLTEWMMGMPSGWSALREQETPKSRCKLPQLIDSLEVCE